ncbi:MAG: phosphatidylserine decarboxylase [bacterium]|nr:phosphatidylserine decarboxylase [bacterium]
MKLFFKLVLPIISLRPISRMWGRIVRLRRPRFLVKRAILRYKKHYGIDMDEYMGEPGDYKSLCDFFVRKLDPEKRRLTVDENAIVSPADGRLSLVETIYEDKAMQVKGKTYPVSQLIGESVDFSKGWHVATIYLAPANYHRYHYPLSGKVTRYLHTGARLYPVNDVGLNFVDRLFVRNERIVMELFPNQNNNEMPCYIVPVGATFVGSIKMEFIEGVAPPAPGKKPKRHQWTAVDKEVKQLEEMGRFEMGSTIVMVIPKTLAEPVESAVGKPVRVGQAIFKF